jgi:hypothetical protein
VVAARAVRTGRFLTRAAVAAQRGPEAGRSFPTGPTRANMLHNPATAVPWELSYQAATLRGTQRRDTGEFCSEVMTMATVHDVAAYMRPAGHAARLGAWQSSRNFPIRRRCFGVSPVSSLGAISSTRAT